ncbi:hypothetical protein M6B38_310500 [Iris pallida]|uniref:Uncharacterized protein n=1 Tax=Iris pallida TaxID=29817 RepID=A0AAX6HGX6_IRIPA|nr:hypothetical protein M6B38_310500 [Iris pallida]
MTPSRTLDESPNGRLWSRPEPLQCSASPRVTAESSDPRSQPRPYVSPPSLLCSWPGCERPSMIGYACVSSPCHCRRQRL